LAPDWKLIQERYLHTLGNLTLTGYNSELSDRPFREKRDMKGGFRDSPIRLNKSLAALDDWNEDAIKTRGQALAELAVKTWIYPTIPAELLKTAKAKSTSGTYSLDDHAKLTGDLLSVFNALRNRIHALDSSITEVIKKRYISFQLRRGFVRIAAQTDRLRLLLHIKKVDLTDPLNLARPFPKSARAKRVKVRVHSNTNLDAVMELVEQAYKNEKRKGHSE
jgi:predicted transport protein